jgi:hypothetical protein
MIAPPIFDVPTVRHPVRWACVALGLVVVLIASADPAEAHAQHQQLSEGFEARIAGVVDAQGAPASPDLQATMAADGTLVTVTYDGPAELVVLGEQASEPLIRMSGGRAQVNASSPQAVQVRGADVDPAMAAELIDLVWERAPEQWVALDEGSTVSFMDHRAVPGHPPLREEFSAGEIAAEWRIPLLLDGAGYSLTGDVVAVGAAPAAFGTSDLIVGTGGVLFAAIVVLFAARGWRSARTSRGAGDPRDDAERTSEELVASR